MSNPTAMDLLLPGAAPLSANLPLSRPYLPALVSSCVASVLPQAGGLVDDGAGGVASLLEQVTGTVLPEAALGGNTNKMIHGISPSGLAYVAGRSGANANGCGVRIPAADFSATQPFSVVWCGTFPDNELGGMIGGSVNQYTNTGWYLTITPMPGANFNYGATFVLSSDHDGNAAISVQSPYRVQNGYQFTQLPQGRFVYVFTYDGSGAAAGVKSYLNGTQEAPIICMDALAGNSINGPGNIFCIGEQFGYTSDCQTFAFAAFSGVLNATQITLLTRSLLALP